jgi:hypothetical protein
MAPLYKEDYRDLSQQFGIRTSVDFKRDDPITMGAMSVLLDLLKRI